nr:MAG TPA: hypothetical protein [Caudoviricetes sp.]
MDSNPLIILQTRCAPYCAQAAYNKRKTSTFPCWLC